VGGCGLDFLLHWAEAPEIMRVLEGPLNEIIFYRRERMGVKGPVFGRSIAWTASPFLLHI
jgi:hypothetical protein